MTEPTTPAAIRLWPDRVPLAIGDEEADVPTLMPLLIPGPGPHPAIVVLPGGGYQGLAPHEGEPVARWLNTLGVSSFVLKYRHAPRYRHPAPMLDAQRSIRTVRANSTEWRVDPNRVGILGFSAGGHLTATVSNLFDDGSPTSADPVERQSSRPDVSIPTYPVISFEAPYSHFGSRDNLLGQGASLQMVHDMSMEHRVTPRTPPTFVFHTVDDNVVPVENALVYGMALRRAGVPFEMHLYERGDHGVGLAPDDAILKTWTARCADWLALHGFAKPK
jgi:acetyl esterase/lipase